MMIKRVLFLSTVVVIAYSAPLYGNDGGYRGFASYVPRKAASRSGVRSDDTIDTSAGSPEISRRPIKREEEEDDDDSSSSIAYSPPKSSAKKYNILDYVPNRQHGYGNNKITEESPSSPYHRATLYGQSAGGYKIADTYQNQHIDSHSGSEEDFKYDDLSNPQSYEYGYALKDDNGNEQHRHETSDGHGTVKGTYGFTDEHGFYRSVEYVADKGGFRASIKTNEPGTENKDPADVHVEAEKLEYK